MFVLMKIITKGIRVLSSVIWSEISFYSDASAEP